MARLADLSCLLLSGLLVLPVLATPVRAQEKPPQSAAATTPAWDRFSQAQQYETGHGAPVSWTKAEAIYLEVMDSADRKAAGLAALAIGNHDFNHGARRTAIAYFQTGAALGEPWSMLKLAELSEKGIAVRKSARQASEFYLKAAASGERKAAMYAYAALGRLYLKPPLLNAKMAVSYYEKAIGLGEYWSAYALAEYYGRQTPTSANRARIRRLLLVALNSGDVKARLAARALSRKLGVSLRSEASSPSPALDDIIIFTPGNI